MSKHFLAVAAASAALMLGACSTVPLMEAGDVSEQVLGGLIFPAPGDKFVILRSTYIAGGLGSYGVRGVNKFSGPSERTSDAAAILTQLDKARRKLKDFKEKIRNGSMLGEVERQRYIDSAVDLVRIATAPTRREYRRRILGLAAGFDAVGAADTARDALIGITKVGRYREAMVLDAREHVVQILGRDGKAITVDKNQQWIDFAQTCQATSDGIVRDEISGASVPRPTFISKVASSGWWDPLPTYLRVRLCDPKYAFKDDREDERAVILAAIEERLDKITLQQEDWSKAEALIDASCGELTRLAGLEEAQNPCKR